MDLLDELPLAAHAAQHPQQHRAHELLRRDARPTALDVSLHMAENLTSIFASASLTHARIGHGGCFAGTKSRQSFTVLNSASLWASAPRKFRQLDRRLQQPAVGGIFGSLQPHRSGARRSGRLVQSTGCQSAGACFGNGAEPRQLSTSTAAQRAGRSAEVEIVAVAHQRRRFGYRRVARHGQKAVSG